MIFHLVELSLHIKIFKNHKMETFLKIENIKLWARVGVLDEERKLGQLFSLDIFLWTDFEKCTANDDISSVPKFIIVIELD